VARAARRHRSSTKTAGVRSRRPSRRRWARSQGGAPAARNHVTKTRAPRAVVSLPQSADAADPDDTTPGSWATGVHGDAGLGRARSPIDEVARKVTGTLRSCLAGSSRAVDQSDQADRARGRGRSPPLPTVAATSPQGCLRSPVESAAGAGEGSGGRLGGGRSRSLPGVVATDLRTAGGPAEPRCTVELSA
jgi:hypothetical protein